MKTLTAVFALFLSGLVLQAAPPPMIMSTYWTPAKLASMATFIPQFASAPQNVQVFVYGLDVAYTVRIDYTDQQGQRQSQAHAVLAGNGTTFLNVDNITNLTVTATPLAISGDPLTAPVP